MHDAWCVIPLAMQDDVACGFPDRPPWRGFGRWLARICALGSGDPPWCSRISRCAALVLLPHCRQPPLEAVARAIGGPRCLPRTKLTPNKHWKRIASRHKLLESGVCLAYQHRTPVYAALSSRSRASSTTYRPLHSLPPLRNTATTTRICCLHDLRLSLSKASVLFNTPTPCAC